MFLQPPFDILSSGTLRMLVADSRLFELISITTMKIYITAFHGKEGSSTSKLVTEFEKVYFKATAV